MTSSAMLLRKGLFPLAVVLSLGFGASQALATPKVESGSARRLCAPEQSTACRNDCLARGYDGGLCYSGGLCQCYNN